MYSERAILKLVECVYDAAGEPQRWPVFLENLVRALNGVGGTFFTQDLANQRLCASASVGIDSAFQRSYEEHYAAKNVYLMRGKYLLSTGNVYPSELLCPDREALRSEFYNEWIVPQRQRHGLLGVLFREQSLTSMIGAIRGQNARPFDGDDLSLVRTLVPHLQRAVQLHRRVVALEVREKAVSGALNHWSIGVILLDHEGRVLLMNRSAEAVLRKRDGLTAQADGLHAGLPHEAAALRSLIHGAIGTSLGRVSHPGGGVTISRAFAGRPLNVLVTPVVAHKALRAESGAAAIVFIGDPDVREETNEDLLSLFYELSHAEARVAALLVQGKSVKEVSESLQVSLNTARTHLKRIFEKTGTRRQAELMQLILQSPVSLHFKTSN
jgi:DNA-binding CsgD family transcriptional regulator/PAS domain-containing protein